MVSSEDFHHTSIGLSAVSYDKEEEIGNQTPDFADNKKLQNNNGSMWVLENGEILEWNKAARSKIRFYAYAPHSSKTLQENSSETSEESSLSPIRYSSSNNIPEISYTVPKDVKKQQDILYYCGDYDSSNGGAVNLEFKHALTAVKVVTGEGVLAGIVKKVILSGVNGQGTLNLGNGEWTLSESEEASFSVTIDKKLGFNNGAGSGEFDKYYTSSGQEIVGTTDNLTFLMIPQQLGENAKLTIVFEDELTKSERILSAPLKGSEWKAGAVVTYSLSLTGLHVATQFDIKNLPDNIPTSGLIHNVKIKSALKLYKLDEDNQETAVSSVEYDVWDNLKIDAYDSNNNSVEASIEILDKDPDKDGYKNVNLIFPATEVFTSMKTKEGFKNATEGSPEAYSDLSGGKETANCYMIDAPGYYKFPTIYGNARGSDKNVNEAAYTYKGGTVNADTEKHILKNFVGHDDNPIKSMSIPYVARAKIVWQDSPDLVTDVTYSDGFVKFRVHENTLNQGNAVIAVEDESGTVLWSWHIWATHHKEDFEKNFVETATSVTIKKDGKDVIIALSDKGEPFHLTKYNLGYCDPHEADTEEHSYTFSIYYELKEGESVVKMPVYENTDGLTQDKIPASLAGDNTFYQWGRKDAMPGGIWNLETIAFGQEYWSKYDDINPDKKTTKTPKIATQYDMENKPIYPGGALKREETYKLSSLGISYGRSIGYAIQHPEMFFMHDAVNMAKHTLNDYWRRHWHDGREKGHEIAYMNYWDANLKYIGEQKEIIDSLGQRPTKTIYDPCPVGFCVPPTNAFAELAEGFTPNSQSISENTKVTANREGNEVKSWTLTFAGGKLIFPATGLRDMGDGNLLAPPKFRGKSNPAHRKITFITTTNFALASTVSPLTGNYYDYEYACMLMYLDDRSNVVYENHTSQNSYGLTVRPIKDEKSVNKQ